MTRSEAIHILRNPYGYSEQSKREAALFICDEVEMLERQSIDAKRYAFLRAGEGVMPHLGITVVGEMLDYALDKAMASNSDRCDFADRVADFIPEMNGEPGIPAYRRIAACLKACEGLPTEALERGKSIKQALMNGLSAMIDGDDLIEAVRVLLPLAERCVGNEPHYREDEEAIEKARALLARFSGWPRERFCWFKDER